jgi:hypothetical protein
MLLNGEDHCSCSWLMLQPSWPSDAHQCSAGSAGQPTIIVVGFTLVLSCPAVLRQVNDIATVIPRNSVIEANQSGLIAEPLIDITPQLPLPTYT